MPIIMQGVIARRAGIVDTLYSGANESVEKLLLKVSPFPMGADF
jgi:hypothetical protein